MRVLVLGGTGYIGARLCGLLQATGWAVPVSASSSGRGGLRLDTRDESAVAQALAEVDAVVNCVAGSAAAITDGAAVLARAAVVADFPRVVHLSSMAIYGDQEGVLTEDAPLGAGGNWYVRAKAQAEREMARLAAAGASVTVLRPGCVWGPGSQLWVGRIARWLRAGRLGDLGVHGDGWSNLVHVDDVCRAVIQSLRRPAARGRARHYNLAAPDSPRWNDYFADLAQVLGGTPLRRLAPLQPKLDAWLAGPPLHVLRKLAARAGRPVDAWPEPLTPGLLALWQRQLRLDATLAQRELRLEWLPYVTGLHQCAAWYLSEHGSREAGKQAHTLRA